jgi:hypothetical protein
MQDPTSPPRIIDSDFTPEQVGPSRRRRAIASTQPPASQPMRYSTRRVNSRTSPRRLEASARVGPRHGGPKKTSARAMADRRKQFLGASRHGPPRTDFLPTKSFGKQSFPHSEIHPGGQGPIAVRPQIPARSWRRGRFRSVTRKAGKRIFIASVPSGFGERPARLAWSGFGKSYAAMLGDRSKAPSGPI